MGIYPIGSLVLLTTREVGIVYKPNQDPKWMDRPAVLLVSRDEKNHPKKEMVDLTEHDEQGRFRRTVVKTLDPFKFHIDVAKYMM